MATKTSTPAKPAVKAAGNPFRALRMAKGYGLESLAAALGTTMAALYAVEKADTLDPAVAKALEALPAKGNPLVERKAPVNKPVRTKTPAQIEADRVARLAHPVTVARLAKGYTREGLAQALEISTTALWHMEQSEGSEAKAHAATITALPQGAGKPSTAGNKGVDSKVASKAKTAKVASKAKVEDIL